MPAAWTRRTSPQDGWAWCVEGEHYSLPEDFATYAPSKGRTKVANRCRTCLRERARTYYATEKGRAAHRDSVLRSSYGVDTDAVELMLAMQNGRCLLCDRKLTIDSGIATSPHVDHDHKTGRLRGLLCVPCNFKIVGAWDRHKPIRTNKPLRFSAEEYLARG